MKLNKTEFTVTLCSIAAALVPLGTWAQDRESGLVAHEWGTFTSVQGGDGVPLRWRPLESSALPKFVYDWQRPGLQRNLPIHLLMRKDLISALQRMETPVIYLYANKPQSVDVSVDFPNGRITEWYPQAAQIGPSVSADPEHKEAGLEKSGARWSQVELLPMKGNPSLAATLPLDALGTHYLAARETDAAYLRVPSYDHSNPSPEVEKFIFYRGTGDFATPLRVTMASGNIVAVTNTGREPLGDLFVLRLENRAGKYIHFQRLGAGEQRTAYLDFGKGAKAVDSLADTLARALVSQGLYAREAEAMVNTWKDSWFTEDGVRVLYLLPRAWTDTTLPLTIKPVPRELVRVMVGRAEVLAPALEQRLSVALGKAKQGDVAAREQVSAEFKRLGRFAEPALRLAVAGSDPKTSEIAWQLLLPAPRLAKASEFE